MCTTSRHFLSLLEAVQVVHLAAVVGREDGPPGVDLAGEAGRNERLLVARPGGAVHGGRIAAGVEDGGEDDEIVAGRKRCAGLVVVERDGDGAVDEVGPVFGEDFAADESIRRGRLREAGGGAVGAVPEPCEPVAAEGGGVGERLAACVAAGEATEVAVELGGGDEGAGAVPGGAVGGGGGIGAGGVVVVVAAARAGEGEEKEGGGGSVRAQPRGGYHGDGDGD